MKKLSLVFLLCCISIAAMAQTISGTLSACVGVTVTLTATPAGGTWTSSSVTNATVGASSGIVSALLAGTATMVYHAPGGGTATAVMTVNALPAPITGTPTVAVGSTTTLNSTPATGTWLSGNPSIASITTPGTAAIVLGEALGTAAITYTLPTGCAASRIVTVTAGTNERALNFDGVNDYVYVAGGLPSTSAEVTYEAWVKPTLLDGSFHSIINTDAFSSGQVHLQFNSSNALEFAVPGANPANQVSSFTFTPNTWYHIAVVYSSTANYLKIYINGILHDNLTYISTVPIASGQAYSIGGWFHGFIDRAFKGSIDEVRIWNIARSASQISANKNCDVAQNTNLKAYFRFNQGTAGGTNTTITTASDFSGVGNCGVLHNFALSGSTSNFIIGNIGTCDATANANVNPGTISGGTTVAVSGTLTLSETVSGGSWSASNSNASVSSAGVVTGLTAGSVTITYTVTSACGTAYTTKALTITPGLGAISGTTVVCVGGTTGLTNATSGGAWASSTPSVATVNSLGIVTGIANGTASITYTVGTATTSIVVSVNPLPPAISGVSSACIGIPVTFTDAVSGGTWSTSSSSIATISSSGLFSPVAAGTVVTTYTLPTGCYTTLITAVQPLPSAIGGPTAVCVGSTITLTNSSFGGLSWSSSNTSVATIGSLTGVVTGISAGSTTITYTLASGCYTTATIIVNPLPGAITGSLSLCSGNATTLSSTTTGGTWSTSSTTVATIGASSGVLTAGSAGTSTITYTLGTGCRKTAVVTVNSVPATISGTSDICAGTSVTMMNSVTGGSWFSSNASIASVNSSTGVVTGIATGSATISYVLPAGCYAAIAVSVGAAVSSIAGPGNICTALPSTLTNASPGGTWSSSNTAIATIISGTGVVTGVTPGTVNITYTLNPGCKATANLTVNATPPAVTGASSVCAGQTTTFANTTTGGSWVSSNTLIATVDAGAGIITGVSAGTANISYIVGSGCYAVKMININPLPASITGAGTVCVGAITTLSDATTGGMSWTSSNASIATVTSGGVVTGVSAGSANITYTLSTGCFITTPINVNPLPATISGSTFVCIGSTSTLTNADAGGTWTSGSGTFASIGSTTGILTGLAAGTSFITYTLPTGCRRIAIATVNALPAAITGPTSVCAGSTIVLSDATTGGTWSSGSPATASISASGVVTGLATGSAVITYSAGTSCYRTYTITVSTALASITGSTSLCTGIPSPLSIAATGGTWSSSSVTVATVSASGVVTGVSAGTANITYAVSSGCRSVVAVGVNTAPPGISGPTGVCVGNTATYTDATTGGTWSSSNPSVATIDAASGMLTGVAAGSTVLTYNAPTGCYTIKTVAINAIPAAISGSASVCVGATTTLTDATSGGVSWSSNNTAVATISTTGGVVTGISAGTTIITYTLGTGCYITRIETVNPLPSAISGSLSVCIGSTTTLSDADAGGTWTSPTGTYLTVGSSSGIVTGMSVGTSQISYTLPTGCRTVSIATVIAVPATITGPSSICVGSVVTLTDATSGGIWTSSDPTVAIATTGGIVTGITTGTATISYTVSSGCYRTMNVTVSALAAIIGTPAVCAGSTTTLSHTVSSGTWSSGSTGIATVGAGTGIVTGVAAGTANITYTVATGCFVTVPVVVNASPGAITGAPNVCLGSTATLSTATGGGTWNSSDVTKATITSSGAITGVSTGTVVITYTAPSGCLSTRIITVSPLPAAITGNTSLCVTTSTTLSTASAPGTSWVSSDISVANVGLISGVVTGASVGTATITFTSYAGCIATTTVTVNPLPSSISGTNVLCSGSGTSFSASPTGGTWSSSSAGILSVSPGSGFASAGTPGIAVISYTVGSGCVAFTSVTVNPVPAPITGTGAMCIGSTASFSTTSTGGTWLSSLTTVATVGTSSGIATGIDTGLTTIYYVFGTGCLASRTLTVGLGVPNITGTPTTCIGLTTALSNTATGGSWISSNPSIATVDASGTVTGAAAGTAVITYSMSTGCFATTTVTVSSGPSAITGTTLVCAGSTTALSSATSGGTWSSNNLGIATIDATTGMATGVNGGTVIITYATGASCRTFIYLTVNPVPAFISGVTTICAGSTAMLTNSTTGGTWSSSATGVATISSTGLVTGISAGSTSISYTLSTGCARVMTLTVSAPPAAISGATPVCTGATSTLSHSTSGGVWTSSNPAVATIAGATGIVTGITAGTANITYTIATGCIVTTPIVINAHPSAITGNPITCIGSATTYSATPSGGTWSSSNMSVADAASSTGIISGMSLGTSVITYTLPTGCTSVRTVSVNAAPPAITGATSVCVGATTTLISFASGGLSWSSSDVSVASIGTFSGIVTGNAPGTATITYNMSSSCLSTVVVTVNAAPGPISGITTMCMGTSSALSASPSGGTWTSSNTAVGTIDASGTVTALTAGATYVTYSIGAGCNSIALVSVNPSPSAIMGGGAVCLGQTATLSATPAGGTWASNSTTIATIGSSTGLISSVSTGTTTITYLLPTGCLSTTTVTVSTTLPAITGTPSVCIGLTTTLANATPGGTWSSSNPAKATVVAATGVVTGVATGTTMITYALSAGCSVTRLVAVSSSPALVTGTASMCVGGSTPLSSADAGGTWTSSNTAVANVGTGTGVVSGMAAGTAIITYSLSAGCKFFKIVTVNPVPSAITGSSVLCVGAVTTLVTTPAGGTWASSDMSVATIGTSGIVTAMGTGNTDITYVLSTGCLRSATLTVNAIPAAISGTAEICQGLTTALSHATTGGTWSSSNTSVAAAGLTSGIVTGVTSGTATITYFITPGCMATQEVTVDATPSPITGVLHTCVGSTATLASLSTGGTWSSSNTAVATIDPATGVVSGVATGTSVITYMLSTGCQNTATITVNAMPTPITGTTTLCAGGTTTLFESVVGTSWSSSNTSIATIGSISGVVTAISTGTTTITFLFTTGCTSTTVVTVTSSPSAIGGAAPLCAGSSATLTSSPAGGTWSSNSTAVATINSSTGLATGVAAGATIITYSIGAGCNATRSLIVNPLPAAITGASTVCIGSSIALSSATTGGLWSSDDASVATVAAGTGLTTGTGMGTTTISYSLGTGCARTRVVSVGAGIPAITGTLATCVGLSSPLANSVSGGTWTSSNTSVAIVAAGSGMVTGIAGGTANITYSTGTGCFATAVVTVATSPAAITGTNVTCQGSTTTLSSTDAGGTWSSSNLTVATVDAFTGVVTGNSGGTSIITYALSGGCRAFRYVTINALPSPIAGAVSICTGSTVTLSSLPAGGTWTSSNASVATIAPTGSITGVAAGTTLVSYTLSTGCARSAVVGVSTISPITGNLNACSGSTTTLSNATPGGTWSSSSIVVATVSGGVVTPVSLGIARITYTLTPGCYTYVPVTVNPIPAAITGATSVCVNATATLTETTLGGTWSSSSPFASIDPATGVATGNVAGSLVMSYTLPTGCFRITPFLVKSLPAPIVGNTAICVGGHVTLTDPTPGGASWISSDPFVASVGGTSGVVTGVSGGNANITFTLATGCYITKVVTVSVTPDAGIITGPSSVSISGSMATPVFFTDPVGSGMWSSSDASIASINAFSGQVVGVSAGAVDITYTYNNGCGSAFTTASLTITAPRGAGNMAQTENAAPANVLLYPNPTSGVFTINADAAGTFTMYTLEGKLLTTFAIAAGTNTLNVPAGTAAGIYMCRYDGVNGNSVMVRLVYEQ